MLAIVFAFDATSRLGGAPWPMPSATSNASG